MIHTRKIICEESERYKYGVNKFSYKSGVSEMYLIDVLRSRENIKDYLWNFDITWIANEF